MPAMRCSAALVSVESVGSVGSINNSVMRNLATQICENELYPVGEMASTSVIQEAKGVKQVMRSVGDKRDMSRPFGLSSGKHLQATTISKDLYQSKLVWSAHTWGTSDCMHGYAAAGLALSELNLDSRGLMVDSRSWGINLPLGIPKIYTYESERLSSDSSGVFEEYGIGRLDTSFL